MERLDLFYHPFNAAENGVNDVGHVQPFRPGGEHHPHIYCRYGEHGQFEEYEWKLEKLEHLQLSCIEGNI
jgi:hypothetical protein